MLGISITAPLLGALRKQKHWGPSEKERDAMYDELLLSGFVRR